MRLAWQRWREMVSTGFWFVPTVMVVLAAVAALGMVALDRRLDPGLRTTLDWAYSGGPEGARSLLSTIAGSMITAASVTFSLASVALSIASQQYGSRVLRNFMRDRVTQVLLGTFVSTFIYSVLVVRTIRGSTGSAGFVPSIATTVAILMTLISLILLIFFIHHVSSSIQASHIVDTIGREMVAEVGRLFPSSAGRPAAPDASEPDMYGASSVTAAASGYLQVVDLQQILDDATSNRVIVRLVHRPGDYIVRGAALAEVAVAAGEDIAAALERMQTTINAACVFGPQRTPAQDVRFTFQQLSEVTIRALSPGINDPFTAVYGIDRLSEGLCVLAERDLVPSARKDKGGVVRLIADTATFPEIADAVFGHILVYAKQDPFVLRRMLTALRTIEPRVRNDADAACVRRHRQRIEAQLAMLPA